MVVTVATLPILLLFIREPQRLILAIQSQLFVCLLFQLLLLLSLMLGAAILLPLELTPLTDVFLRGGFLFKVYADQVKVAMTSPTHLAFRLTNLLLA
jgi:hypothetical protein